MLCLGLYVSSCDTTKRAVGTTSEKMEVMDPYVGSWNYVVKDTPEGDIKGLLVIEKAMEKYTARISGEQGEVDLGTFNIVDNQMQGTFDYQGYELTMKGIFSGKTIKGDIGVEFMSFPMEGKKVDTAPAAESKN